MRCLSPHSDLHAKRLGTTAARIRSSPPTAARTACAPPPTPRRRGRSAPRGRWRVPRASRPRQGTPSAAEPSSAAVGRAGPGRPRSSQSAIVTVAAVLATNEPERLYAGLSVLVSSATDGEPCAALASFGSLELLLDDRSSGPLADLVKTALQLDNLTVHACSAATQTLGVTRDAVTDRGLDGVKSTPRFLKDSAGATLIFV